MKREPRVALACASLLAPILLAAGDPAELPPERPDLLGDLRGLSARIAYETLRGENWELFLMKADGSDPVNLTRTPDRDDLYPHFSPDGTKVCFVVDREEAGSRARSVWIMDADGTGRTLVGMNIREPCWSPDGSAVAYLKAEFKEFTVTDYATSRLCIYDLKSRTHREHPNPKLHHLYNICWSPDSKWFLATVHAGMGYDHAILAIEANGQGVFDLGLGGCRPDISPDGKKVAWGVSDWAIRVGDLDLSGPRPLVTNKRDVVTSGKPIKVYHADWSPDGNFIAYSRGPIEKKLGPACEIVGVRADGWNICVADARKLNRWVSLTKDDMSNKEPDWAPEAKGRR